MEALVVGVLIGLAIYFVQAYARRRHAPPASPAPPATAAPNPATVVAPGGTAAAAEGSSESQVYRVVEDTRAFYDAAAHPQDLIDSSPDFNRGVALLCEPGVAIDTVIAFALGENVIIACMAMEALRRRDDAYAALATVLGSIGRIGAWPQYFALKLLAEETSPEQPIIAKVLNDTTGYLDYRLTRLFLKQFVAQRIDAGEEATFEGIAGPPQAVDRLRELIGELEPKCSRPVIEALDRWQAGRVDRSYLSSVGRIWGEAEAKAAGLLVEHPRLAQAVDALEAALAAKRPQSTLIIGERGVGKSAILQRLARRLHDQGWTIFVCGHADLIAGQVYIGQFEERLKTVVDHLRKEQRMLWIVPGFPALAFSGRHAYSPVSALDVILPLAEKGELRIVGEATPAALERLQQQQPRATTALAALRIEPLDAEQTLDVARQWLAPVAELDGEEVLAGAWDLAQQYLAQRAAPGNLLALLDATLARLRAQSTAGKPRLGIDDVILTLSQQTGLPEDLLDHRSSVDLGDLRSTLRRQVIGQDEAIECLVERIAMVKAGLNDPARPLGVFLFAGPTGTGKTEIAKTLAEWLFGDAQRLLRLDMSELQTAESLNRLLGEADPGQGDFLAEQIRKQPFAVVLLDEFEKAHPQVWDVFLQVFDDARITDRRGQSASFRHAIIILTSNLGAAIPTGVSLGFGNRANAFDAAEVHRAIGQVFRKEFINRLDRVVVFQPLSRDLMRRILHKELAQAFRRRGLKDRAWAVEWDEAAIEFLLAKGFTPDLGARPLRRAIEQHLLAPLAITIVEHQAPEGDQFLFVTSREDRLEVTFVDPDAPADEEGAEPAPREDVGAPTVQAILIDPRGTIEERAVLRQQVRELEARVGSEAWRARKEAAFAEIQRPDFWLRADRFATLGLTEYIDRVEAGVRRAGSLLQRLDGHAGKGRVKAPVQMVSLLAQNLHLLRVACDDVAEGRPREAWLLIEPLAEGALDRAHAAEFAAAIAGMYQAWAKARRMSLAVLEAPAAGAGAPFRRIHAVAGYGAYSLLVPEHGLHVFERPGGRPRQLERDSVRVRVAPQDDADPAQSDAELLRRAEQAFERDRAAAPAIVRRYRREPSPLVRDSAKGWRTGRLDLVLAGNFDAMQPAASGAP